MLALQPIIGRAKSLTLALSLSLAVASLVGCGGRVDSGIDSNSASDAGTNAACSSLPKGVCTGVFPCVNGQTHTTQWQCDGGQWQCVTLPASCVGASSCPSPTPGLCAPNPTCVNGSRQTGQAACVGGQWVCSTEPCAEAEDAGGAVCGSIDATAYSQTCSSNSDCAVVYSGSLCSDCRCPNAPISASDVSQYQSDVARQVATPGHCGCPVSPPPACVNGVCALGFR